LLFHSPGADSAGSDLFQHRSSTDGSLESSASPPTAVAAPSALSRRDSRYQEAAARTEPAKSKPAATTNKANRDSRPVRGRRVPHHLVERRYRENLNGQIEALRMAIPALQDGSQLYSGEIEDPGAPARMPSKTAIITAAVDHIAELHSQEAKFRDAIAALQTQVSGLQKLVRCDDCSILQYLQSLQIDNGEMASTA